MKGAPAPPPLDVDAVPARGFGLQDEWGPLQGDWHHHARHQLLYAREGVLSLEVADRRWTLPPARAAWIPGGCPHRVAASARVRLATAYLSPDLAPGAPVALAVFDAGPALRALLLHAMRHGPARPPDDAAADRLFAVLGDLAAEAAARPLPLSLPRARSPELARALEALESAPGTATLEDLARLAGVSPRTLNRRFLAETGTTFRRCRQAAQVLAALEALLRPGAQIVEVALEVGFDSPSAFAQVFKAWTGQSPSAYRAVTGGPPPAPETLA